MTDDEEKIWLDFMFRFGWLLSALWNPTVIENLHDHGASKEEWETLRKAMGTIADRLIAGKGR